MMENDNEHENITVIPGKGTGMLYAVLQKRIKDLHGNEDTTDYKIREVSNK